MIPPDLASRLRLTTPDLPAPTQPAAAAQKLTDVLSDLNVGQRIMAEIQAFLPNGTYRALVGQRDVTLALPFSAKPGDTLELEVVETDGKVSLAFVANHSEQKAEGENVSVSSSLSRTGSLIGDLLRDVDAQGGSPRPAQLNANQPLIETFPDKAEQLVPLLKDSLGKSGMFYESHQAQWVAGKLPSAALLEEPQGRLSVVLQVQDAGTAATRAEAVAHPHEAAVLTTAVSSHHDDAATRPAHLPTDSTQADTMRTGRAPGEAMPSSLPEGQTIARELTPVVQQQLNALATQTYAWQGQIWPGQQMQWEITQEGSQRRSLDEPDERHWQTRLKLDLPSLGAVDARLRLDSSGALEISLLGASDDSAGRLRQGGEALQQAMAAAGLKVRRFGVDQTPPPAEAEA